MGVLITDGAFTVVVTAAFLRPILETLRSGDTHRENFIDEGAAPRSDAVKLILRTKWMTLTGVAVAVASSSILYINFILSFTIRDTIAPNPWLNPVVFMVNADSILNDLGLLLVSGLLTSASSTLKRNVYRVAPAGSSGPLSRNSTELTEAVNFVRLQLETLPSIPNITDEFLPPQVQARGVQLKKIAVVLQEGLFPRKPSNAPALRTMDDGVAKVIDADFGPSARAFFVECVEEARGLVAEMRAQFHGVRHSHLSLYKDTLKQIRKEGSFAELQQRSEQLVLDCERLARPRKQSCNTLSGLCRCAEAVSTRYNKLMNSIAFRVGAIFHETALKGLLRVTEKLALTAGPNNWKPELLCDICRGALELPDFTTMISAVRMFRDLRHQAQRHG
jgi:hypothetical protein